MSPSSISYSLPSTSSLKNLLAVALTTFTFLSVTLLLRDGFRIFPVLFTTFRSFTALFQTVLRVIAAGFRSKFLHPGLKSGLQPSRLGL